MTRSTEAGRRTPVKVPDLGTGASGSSVVAVRFDLPGSTDRPGVQAERLGV
jgi:hypothetical protein